MSARLTVNNVIVSRQVWTSQERKHTLDSVSSGRGILVKVAHFVRRAVRGVIGRGQGAIDHVALGPLRPHATRLDSNDFDVPLRGKLLVESLAESLERCKMHSDEGFFVPIKPRRRTKLACRVVGKGGVP